MKAPDTHSTNLSSAAMPDKPDLAENPTPTGKPSGFRTLVGYHVVVWRENYAEIELALGPQHMNSVGITHGGVYMAMLDAAFGHAVTWCPVPAHVRRSVTLSLTTSFLTPAKTGVIKAVGRLEGVSERIATASGEVVDEAGQVLAVGQGSFRYFRGSERVEGVPRGSKAPR
jgi:uncharacterized protein (TIGR00369 family)